jgi:hypothetical protein
MKGPQSPTKIKHDGTLSPTSGVRRSGRQHQGGLGGSARRLIFHNVSFRAGVAPHKNDCSSFNTGHIW